MSTDSTPKIALSSLSAIKGTSNNRLGKSYNEIGRDDHKPNSPLGFLWTSTAFRAYWPAMRN